ncbi:MAG: Gfo/Idh/MocA family protein [Pseudomonadota bacterium]
MTLRIAIAGAGLITRSAHLPAVLGHPAAHLTALVDPDLARAKALAQSYGLAPLLARDIEDILAKVDACIIATPNHSHADLAVRCLAAGVHVLIEKPLATNAADGARVIQAAAKNGALAAIGYCTRFRDNVRLFGRLLKSAHFGRVKRFAYQFGTTGGWAALSAYTLDRAASGGGVTVVSGTHFLDRMLHWFGMPDAVDYVDDGHQGPEANAHCHFRFAAAGNGEGFQGSARFSKTVHLPGGMVVETEKGRLILPESPTGAVRFLSHDSPDLALIVEDKGPSPYPPGTDDIQRQFHHFLMACRGEQPFPVTAEDGQASLILLDRLYQVRQPLPEPWRMAGAPGEEAVS